MDCTGLVVQVVISKKFSLQVFEAIFPLVYATFTELIFSWTLIRSILISVGVAFVNTFLICEEPFLKDFM